MWIAALLVMLAAPAHAGSLCNDGTYSSSSGRGACSHHGGVANSGGSSTSRSSGATSSGTVSTPDPAATVGDDSYWAARREEERRQEEADRLAVEQQRRQEEEAARPAEEGANPDPATEAPPPKKASKKKTTPPPPVPAVASEAPPTAVEVEAHGDEPSGLAGVVRAVAIGSIVFTGLLIVGVPVGLVWAISRGSKRRAAEQAAAAARQAADAVAAAAAAAELGRDLEQLLVQWEKDPEVILAAVASGLDVDQHFRPKKGERVLWAVPATLAKMVTETRASAYGGLGASMKIWGPLRVRVGSTKVERVRRTVLREQGAGVLVVTTKRLHFNMFGTGKDWSRTWKSIATWGVYEDALQVELSNGSPMVFMVDASKAITHPGFLAAVFEYGHDGGRRDAPPPSDEDDADEAEVG